VNSAAIDNAALRCACEIGHTEIVRLLLDLPLDRGVDPAANDNAALPGPTVGTFCLNFFARIETKRI